MKRILCFFLSIAVLISLCACNSNAVGEDVYDEVAAVCDKCIEENDFKRYDSYTVESIRYEINEITKHKVTKDYVVNITWYIDFSDTYMMESVWCENWINSVKYVLDDLVIDGHNITHTNENYYDSVFVVVNGGEPYSGYDEYRNKVGTSGSVSENAKDTYGHDRFDAIVIAEKIVEDNLKSPSSAEFCGNSDYSVSCTDNTWTVEGYVDAQNDFGATLRNDFVVKFTFVSSEKYTIDSCIFN